MISKKTPTRLAGLPVVLSLVATPLLASAPDSFGAGTAATSAASHVEMIFPRFAQVGGDEIGGSDNDRGEDNPAVSRTGPPVAASTARTTLIVQGLDDSNDICAFMSEEYRIGCFAATYRDLAEDIPANGDYAEAREVLLDTARKLDNLVRDNLDRQKPPLQARIRSGDGRSEPTSPMRAVQADRAPQLNQQASNIVAEAETVLLRSASSDATRAIHFQRIAAAVGSNKVLLRSS